MRTTPVLLALSALLASACEPAVPPGPPVAEVTLESVGLDGTALDRSVDPCQDFYQFACGSWIARTQIPADKPLWTRSFSVIAEQNEAKLRKILDDAAAGKGGGDAVTQKIGAYYGACMDEASVEAAGTKPIEPLLALVKKVTNDASFTEVVTELHKRQIWALFELSDTQDAKDATRVIAEIDQRGLGLPDRDYYLKDDERSKDIRTRYVAYVERMMHLAGLAEADAKRAAADVMRIETELAQGSKTRVERRDPPSMYNRLDRAGVAKAIPRLRWDAYFAGLGVPALQPINVTAPKFLAAVSALLDKETPAAWQSYLSWHVVRAAAPLLPAAFVDEAFKFESSLTGQKAQRARWKRCVEATDGALGELLAQPFVKESFSPESKEATETYVKQIARAFGAELAGLDWMDGATKQKGAEKLAAMAYLIGYPSKWRSYDFPIEPRRYAENALAARAFDERFHLAKVGKPVDREEWHMTPPTVNAYYSQQLNEMVFPAGILQPPFFNPKAGVPVNLGGMGMVVGHELTHGFDDKGSQFDAKGNLDNWWTAADKTKFEGKTRCVAEQYAGYETIPGVKLNGKLTLGENIADGGGVKLAFAAYRALRKGAPTVVKAGGFTEDQQFFLGVGQAWCAKLTDETARLRAQIDTHAPPRFRVNGTLANEPAFAAAFSCPAGAPMRRADACAVW
jgi:predicted metalloendopeptidase